MKLIFILVLPNPDKPEIRNSKYETRNKLESSKFKLSKQNHSADKLESGKLKKLKVRSVLRKALEDNSLQRCQKISLHEK